jgi:hypothetical protein
MLITSSTKHLRRILLRFNPLRLRRDPRRSAWSPAEPADVYADVQSQLKRYFAKRLLIHACCCHVVQGRPVLAAFRASNTSAVSELAVTKTSSNHICQPLSA